MKKIIFLFIILIGMLFGIYFTQNSKNGNIFMNNAPKATINNQTFNIVIAKDSKEKEIGLSDKKDLADNEGMLFLFETSDYYSFWMKNMKFPIDIIFIKDDKIINIYENAQPPKSPNDDIPIYQPKSPADKVLEINAGLSSKYSFKEGDVVKLENIQ